MQVKNRDCIILKVLTNLDLEIHIDFKIMLAYCKEDVSIQTKVGDLCVYSTQLWRWDTVFVAHMRYGFNDWFSMIFVYKLLESVGGKFNYIYLIW